MSKTEINQVLELLKRIPASGSFESAQIATEVEEILRGTKNGSDQKDANLSSSPMLFTKKD